MNLKMIWMVPPRVWQSSVVAGLLKCPQSLPLREKSSSILTLQCPHSPGHTGIPVLLSSPLLSSTDFGLIFRTVSSSPKFCLGSFFLTWRSYSFQPLELVTCTYAEDGQFLCSSGVPMSSLGLPGWFFHFWFFFSFGFFCPQSSVLSFLPIQSTFCSLQHYSKELHNGTHRSYTMKSQ